VPIRNVSHSSCCSVVSLVARQPAGPSRSPRCGFGHCRSQRLRALDAQSSASFNAGSQELFCCEKQSRGCSYRNRGRSSNGNSHHRPRGVLLDLIKKRPNRSRPVNVRCASTECRTRAIPTGIDRWAASRAGSRVWAQRPMARSSCPRRDSHSGNCRPGSGSTTVRRRRRLLCRPRRRRN
jgi:hypothetical protein